MKYAPLRARRRRARPVAGMPRSVALVVAVVVAATVLQPGAGAQEPPPQAPAPSTDGWIVYQSNVNQQGGAGTTHDVWIARGDGTSPQKLTVEAANLDRDDGEPTFASDATSVVFASCRDNDQLVPCVLGDITKVTGNANIWSMRPDGSGQQPITQDLGHDASPALSPDGQTVAFVSLRDGDPEIFTVAADGTGPRTQRTSNVNINDFAPVWSPDGSRLAFVSNRASAGGVLTGNNNIWVMNADGTGVRAVTNNTASDTAPAWSKDGTHIAFVSNRDGDDEIFVLEVDGPAPETGLTQLTANTISDIDPAWSPDGLEIAFSSNRDGDYEIFLMNASGTEPRQVTNNTAVDVAPDWVENVQISASSKREPASPASIPVNRIPLQPASPQVQADISGGFIPSHGVLLGTTGIPILDIILGPTHIPTDLIGLGPTGIPFADIILGSTGIPILDIILGPTHIPTDLIGLGWFEALGRMPLSSLPLLPPLSWDQILPGTGLGPAQTTSLRQLMLASDTQPPTLADVGLTSVDITKPPFGSTSLAAFLLGNQPIRSITPPFESPTGWCSRFEALGFANCGAEFGGLDATFLQANIGGLPFDDPEHPIRLQDVTMGSIAELSSDSPLYNLVLRALSVEITDAGSLKVSDLPAATRQQVFNCELVSCADSSAVTLAEAGATFGQDGSEAIAADAHVAQLLDDTSGRIARLPIGEVILAVLGRFPVEAIPYENLPIRGWRGEQSSAFTYTMEFAPVAVAAATDPAIKFTFPSRFFFDSATVDSGEGAESVMPELADDGTFSTATFALDGTTIDAGSKIRMTVVVRPGDRLQLGDVDVDIDAELDERRENVTTAEVTDTFEPNDDCTSASLPTLRPNVLYTSFTPRLDNDCFILASPPAGSMVTITLGHGDIDRDLVVYGDTPADAPLRAVADPDEITDLVGDDGVGFAYQGAALQPDGRSVTFDRRLRVTGFSQLRGTLSDQVSFVSSGSGNYRVQVAAYNGASSTRPYTLRVAVGTPPVLADVEPTVFPFDAQPYAGADEVTSAGVAPAAIAPDTRTLILWNRDRWHDRFGSASLSPMDAKLAALAAHDAVDGAVLAVDGVPDIRAAFQAWDADPGNPEHSNNVVRAVNTYVDGLFDDPETTIVEGPTRDQLKYLVVVGDHISFPFAAVRDQTSWGNESWYRDPSAITGVNAYSAPYLLGYILTDDGYSSSRPRQVPGGWLYQPTWPTGRLVESTSDVTGAIDNFLASNGVVDVRSARSVGADFMKDLGVEIDKIAEQHIGSPQAQLIDDTHTKSQLQSSILGASRPDLVGFQLHSDGHRTLPPAKPANPFTTADLDAATGSIAREWFTMGCHTGDPRPDMVGNAGDPALRNWAQSLAPRAAFFVSQTSFGLGTRDEIVLTEQVVADTVRNSLTGVPTVGKLTIGYALGAAKRDYLLRNGIPGVFDKKSIEAATLYGLPMYGLAGATTADLSGSALGGGTVTAPDPQTGIQSASVTVEPDTETVLAPDGTHERDRRDGVQFTHYRPIVPKRVVNVASDTLEARGVTIEARQSRLRNGVRQKVAKPVLAGDAVEPPSPFARGMSFPNIPVKLTGTGANRSLVALTQHFTATGEDGDAVIGRRLDDQLLTYRVYYGAPGDPDRIAPDFIEVAVDVEDTGTGHVAHFSAEVDDDEGAENVAGVSVLYLDETATWSLAHLVSSEPGLWSASVPFTGPGIEALFQMVDASGNSTFELFKGLHFGGVEVEPETPYLFHSLFGIFTKKALNAGRTVPLRWALSRSGELVSDLGAVQRVRYYEVNSDGSGAVLKDAAGELKLTGSIYHFNWKTDSTWIGKTIAVVVDLDDDSSHSFLFKFKQRPGRDDGDDD